MTTPAERLAAAIHMESAAIAPQTSPLIEAAKEVLVENAKFRGCLEYIAKPVTDRNGIVDSSEALIRAAAARDVLHQQQATKP
jgi:hypothetical protein